MGNQCIDSKTYSFSIPDEKLNILVLNWPCCVLAKRYSVNAALIKDITISGKNLMTLHDIKLLINNTSLNKLTEGGAAILQIHKRNHQSAIDGIICNRPLHTNILRDEVRSNTIFVKQNIPEEHSPCAIIRAKHPVAPVRLPTITPPITSLIWATDE